jgi:hypothetical protein
MCIILYRDITQGETIFAAYRTAGVVKTPKKKARSKRKRSRRQQDMEDDEDEESSSVESTFSDGDVEAKQTIAQAFDDEHDTSPSSADASTVATSSSNQPANSRKRSHPEATAAATKRVKTRERSKLYEVAFGDGSAAPAVHQEPTTSGKSSAKPSVGSAAIATPPGRVLRPRKDKIPKKKKPKPKKSDRTPKTTNTGSKGKGRRRNSQGDDDSDTDMATPKI